MAAREHDLRDALYLAQQSSNAKKDFLSRMSHEIRTPMNVIVGMTTIAGTNLDDKDRVKDCLSKIVLSSKHLLALINDVLDMSKIEEGKLSVNHEEFELQQLFESIVPAIYSQAAAKGSVFECNFISNAIKSTPAGGIIRLVVSQAPVKNGYTKLPLEVPEETDKPEIGGWDNIKVLVVDDDEVACTHASMLLKKMGIDADWVQQGSIAVRMVVKAHEDACDGWIRSSQSHTPEQS